MNVKLISVTKPEVDGVETAEDIITYCARVSNPKNQMNTETAPRLLNFLIKHKHWSPFELASMCVEIKTSRAIAAQILRHRSFSFQEFSQRYSEATELEPIELRSPAETNRQSSSEPLPEDHEAYSLAKASMHMALSAYKNLIKMGVAKETARGVLPLNTETTIYMNGTIRSWIHYINLRAEENTQKEHRDIAEAVKEIIIDKFPNISEALKWKEKN
jgi:thymidylate synthase (FAD)|tara:strand:- start:2523 stop:3173 length:651 start_codon:yes stop_codon:yes gene_type:complete